MPAYEAAFKWGAPAIEVSTSSTSDGLLICMHDLTYDRTTNTTGIIHDIPSSALSRIGVLQPQLGPAWTKKPLPQVPTLEDVFKRFGGRVVLCVEPKRDADYQAVIAMIEKYRLQDSVIVKLYHGSVHIGDAKKAGYPRFVYLTTSDVSLAAIADLAARLDKTKDYLVIPTSSGQGQEYLPTDLVTAAVKTGVPTWVYPVHRRSEAERYFSQGVAGIISSSVGYSSRALAPVVADDWNSGAIASGEVTRDPTGLRYAPKWEAGGVFRLDAQKAQHFVLLGQFAPIAAAQGSYTIEFEACWDRLPANRVANMSIAFAHENDRYYEHQLGNSNGYHATQRASGLLELHSHTAGVRQGTPLGKAVSTPAPKAGQWMAFQLTVTPTSIAWSRQDARPTTSVIGFDAGFRGGYFHIGRSSTDGSLSFRNLRLL